jgi:hypothetical protein
MTRTRTSASLAFAAALTGSALSWVAATPVANADTLPNGLTVTCTQDSDIHSTCIVGGCPRVNGDYVVDALHVTWPGGRQNEYSFKCINGETHREGSSLNSPSESFDVQACRKSALGTDDCTPWAHYTFNPPAPVAPPPPPVAPAAPAPVVPPPAAPVVPAPAAPAAPTATVNADTDLYDKPSDQGGHIIGQLKKGQVVTLGIRHNTACSADAWCYLFDPTFGVAWGRDLTNN